MAQKKNTQANAPNTPVNKQPSHQAAKSAAPKTAQKNTGKPPAAASQKKLSWNNIPTNTQAIIVGCIALITWFFLKVCLDNKLTNWDDPGYIKDDGVIKNISAEGIKNIFSTSIMGNYHPLTILSYAIDYAAKGLDPYRYHLDSLVFHIIVTVLVYIFVNLLTRRPIAAMISALLFALHPMHMESVAWVSGRKDVVYGMFYMAACITWVCFIRTVGNKKWAWYAATALLFVCSLLGKPVAVILPVTLLVIDYFEKRKFNVWLFIEKAPLLAISAGFGFKSIYDQKHFGSLDTLNVSYTYLERIGLGGYALITYLWKAVAPIQLCNYYPYPDKIDNVLPYYYYIYPIAVVAGIIVLWKLMHHSHAAENNANAGGSQITTSISANKVVVFGSLFFLVNIILLLQFIPVGGAIIADRYSYIPYLGLFIMAGWFVSSFFEPGGNRQMGYVALSGALIYILYLGFLSNQRCQVWYDTSTLWADEIEKEPARAPNAYNNLGFNYFNKFNDSMDPAERKRYYDSAFYLLNKAIELQPTFVNPYISLGELERTANDFPDAKRNYYKALSLKSFDEDANAYLGLAIIYAIEGQAHSKVSGSFADSIATKRNFDSSLFCFRSALKLKPVFPEAVSNYGNLLDIVGQHDSALVQYGIAITQNPDMYAPYLNRGRALQRMRRCDEAMQDFEKALQISPEMGEIYYARSFCEDQKGNKALALQDIKKAASLGFRGIDRAYYQAMGGK